MKGPTSSYCDIEDSKRKCKCKCECKNNIFCSKALPYRPKTKSI